jgi:uncharacterized protein (DUF2235 family)
MKRLIVCCDGTWQRPDQTFRGKDWPTNVVRLASAIAKLDGSVPQVVWYHEGVGTGNLVDLITGGLTGLGLDENISEAYRFLVSNYVPGDELYLFGFSRGAYTVRSLAGMIRKCGIVRPERIQNYAKVMSVYRDPARPDAPGPTNFRASFSISGTEPIPVKFIGVWDTVGALGIPLTGLSRLTQKRYQFHDTELSGTVEYAYQALAVDERRTPFSPSIWTYVPKPGQTVEQVWFSGSHSDVGGGAASRGLPEITLQWMIEKARGAGLVIDPAVVSAYPGVADPFAAMNFIERSRLWHPIAAERRIGLGDDDALDPTQSLNPSVLQRWDMRASYRPSNLNAYFLKTGNSRGVEERATLLGRLSGVRA